MKRSLDLAAATQQSLLPAQAPALDRFDVAGRCLYCDETGGDYYDFIELGEGANRQVGVALGDVSGHGIGAALLMAATRGVLHTAARQCVHDLEELFGRLNRELISDTGDDRFLTLFYGILGEPSCELTWASAGHEPATWYHGADGRLEELKNTGMPLGIVKEAVHQQAGPIVLAPGDVLVVGTDGIWEARNDRGEFFGKERFRDVLQKAAAHTADEIGTAVIDGVLQFVGAAPRVDDITLVVIKAKPEGQ
jgi:sigma-B regulation protein RsbU (phosphoserine phosphatase)